jgi:phosphatidylinositol alpha-mannosyltransferase
VRGGVGPAPRAEGGDEPLADGALLPAAAARRRAARLGAAPAAGRRAGMVLFLMPPLAAHSLPSVRVALVCPYSLSTPGGVQGQVLALARALGRGGHDAIVLGPSDLPVADAGLPAGAVIGLGRTVSVPANGSVARLSLSPLAAARAVEAVRRLHPDVLHLHEPLAPGPNWALLSRPQPKVGTFHRAGAVRAGRLLAPAGRLLASRLAARTAVSEAARATASALVAGEYVVTGNGVELERFATATPWPTDGPTVLFVGRHEPRKGLDVLLEAFGGLDRSLRARLWVTGEGPQTAELRRRFGALAGVQWLGRLDGGELDSRLAAATVLCAPSRFGESFGVVLVEAMAGRAVVVASDIPGYAAVVGPHGVLVPPGDALALRRALEAVLADAAAGRGAGSAERLDAAAAHARTWSMEAVAGRYLEVYRSVLEPGAR